VPGRDVLPRPARLPDLVLRYADHDDGVVDVHLPEGRRAGPLLVLLHGGFWRAAWDRRHTRPMADALAGRGFVVATPEYRRTGAGGGYPATTEDVLAATRRLPGLLRALGLEDPAGTGATLVGHSAGGHLALWLAAHDDLRLRRVVALAPVGDLVDAFRRDLDDGAVRALMGGAPDRADYGPADPATLLAARRPGGVPVVVLHGTRDDRVPLANSDWARDRPGVTLRVLPGADHFGLVDPASDAWPEVLRAVEQG
jgi:pimeloyl-ACP methyl ester carboxylesterase